MPRSRTVLLDKVVRPRCAIVPGAPPRGCDPRRHGLRERCGTRRPSRTTVARACPAPGPVRDTQRGLPACGRARPRPGAGDWRARGARSDFPGQADIAYFKRDVRPPGGAEGLEVSSRYAAQTPIIWANAAHVGTCEVDGVTGKVTLLRYIVSEDCGPMINPNVVEGQIAGGDSPDLRREHRARIRRKPRRCARGLRTPAGALEAECRCTAARRSRRAQRWLAEGTGGVGRPVRRARARLNGSWRRRRSAIPDSRSSSARR